MNKYFELILGVALFVCGTLGIYYWRSEVLTLIKGFIGPILLLIGIIFIWIAYSEISSN